MPADALGAGGPAGPAVTAGDVTTGRAADVAGAERAAVRDLPVGAGFSATVSCCPVEVVLDGRDVRVGAAALPVLRVEGDEEAAGFGVPAARRARAGVGSLTVVASTGALSAVSRFLAAPRALSIDWTRPRPVPVFVVPATWFLLGWALALVHVLVGP